MPLELSNEVTVSINKDVETGSCAGVVITCEGDSVQIALRERGILVKNGSLVHIKSHADASVTAWGSVERFEYAGDVKLITIGSVRYEGGTLTRAIRCPVQLWLSANYRAEDLDNVTFGQTVDMSLTGIRAKFFTPIPQGTSLHMLLHLDEGKTVEAIARVARIISDGEAQEQGYEVGLEFQRFIRGYEFLIDTAPSGRELAA